MNRLRNEFWKIVTDETTKQHFNIASGCESELRHFIDGGIAQLSADGLDPEKIKGAKIKLRFYVEEMIMFTKLRNPSHRVLQETSFREILRKLCPLFPFC
jgi:hypothetical protein